MSDDQQTTGYIDTHTHLDDEQFSGDIGAVIEGATAAGVSRVINIGYRPDRWTTTIDLARQFTMLSFTIGLHPHHADEWTTSNRRRLEQLLETSGAVAVGEIGIDRFRDGPPLALQRNVFERQLLLAEKWKLPAVIHQRAAETEVLDVLRQAPRSVVCVLHSFEGSSELAALGRERGHYFGVGGLMTRKNAGGLREVLATVPLDRILLETDAPYLVPTGIKARRNEPANIPCIADRLASLLNLPVVDIKRVTTMNALNVFGIPTNDATTR